MSSYPAGHEPRLFIAKAAQELGADVQFDWTPPKGLPSQAHKLPGFTVNGRIIIYLLDNRMPDNQWQNDAAKRLKEVDPTALVCCAQVTDAKEHGFFWLPLGVTPSYIVKPLNTIPTEEDVVATFDFSPERTYDFAFVGYLNDTPRESVMERLQSKFNGLICSGVFGDEAISTYRNAKCGVNVTAFYGSQFAHDLNMRVFEVMATGTILVTPEVPGMEELGFVHGENCLTYTSLLELMALLRFVKMGNVGIDGAKAQAWALDKHSYQRRAERLLKRLAVE